MYLQTFHFFLIILKDISSKKSEVNMLNRKASVGPYIKNVALYAGHSGITINLPKVM